MNTEKTENIENTEKTEKKKNGLNLLFHLYYLMSCANFVIGFFAGYYYGIIREGNLCRAWLIHAIPICGPYLEDRFYGVLRTHLIGTDKNENKGAKKTFGNIIFCDTIYY